MTALTIRNIDPRIKDRLRRVAAEHGHSMEEEVRVILRRAVMQSGPTHGLGSRLHERFAAIGGIDIEVPARTQRARAAHLEDDEAA